ncbi:MAG TPA: hypothetical protein VF215_16470, partial [Thermoanaerobaculia bacterium]
MRDRIIAPFTADELARAIRWAREWYLHEKQEDSLPSAFAALLFAAAAEDFARGEQESDVRRSVFALRDVKKAAETLHLATPPTKNTIKGTPASVATNIESFRHYYRLDRNWYRFTFFGPGLERRDPGAAPQAHGNYYLAVEYEPVSATVVPADRRHHRPGHLRRRYRAARRTSRAGAPFPSPDFIGRRKELYEALRCLVRSANPVVSVHGLPGVGKTEFVSTLVDWLGGRFGDGHVYLHASVGGVRRPAGELLREAIAALDPDAVLASEDSELVAQYRALVRGRRCAVICENALSADDVLPFLPHRGSALIVTSREYLSLPGAPIPLVLPTFPPELSNRFLREIAERVDVAASAELVEATIAAVPKQRDRRILTVADVVATLSGDLPLALRVCGSYLAQHPDVAPQAFAHSFLDMRRRLELRGARAATLSVEASVALSYDALTDDERAAFRRLGIFASSFGRTAAVMMTHDAARLADEGAPTIVSELVQHGLVTFDPYNRRYGLHELLRAFAVTRLSASERTEALQDLVSYYHYFAGIQMLWMREAEATRVTATESTFAEEFPNVEAAVEALLVSEPARDALYHASDVVLGLAPFLLRTAPERFLTWSERLWRAFEPLAREGVVHVQPTPSARAHVHAGPDWGRSGLRLIHHVYHCGLALETRTERTATDQAMAYYYGMREVMDELRLTDGPSHQILAWASTRLVRLVRRGGVAPTQVARFATIRVLEGGELGPVDGVLTYLVRVQAYADGGLHDEGVETARRLLALWRSHDAAVPWAAALYLDALSEYAPAWFWAYHQHVVREGEHLVLVLLDHALQVTETAERPTDPTLEDVARHFRMQPLDRVRTPYPLAMGAALVALGLRREAVVFHDAAVRIAEWVC